MNRWAGAVVALTLAGCGDAAGPPEPALAWEATQVLLRDQAITADKVMYRSDGYRIVGVVCRPLGSGPYPVLMLNHGGWSGLGTELDASVSGCAAVARNGYVVLESSYRGEDGSEGPIELCAGESRDVRRMLDIVLAQSYADPTRVSVLGGSHGGCITYGAMENGLPAQRAVALAGPSDLGALYDAMADSIAAGVTGDRLSLFQLFLAEFRRILGGSPEEKPAVYAARSFLPRANAVAAWSGRLMIQHGTDDDIVPVEQSCALVKLMGGFEIYHVDDAGATTPAPPEKCASFGLTWQGATRPGQWPGRRYFVVYDGVGHGSGKNADRLNADTFAFLFTP
ncbi:MAG: prolyl oligopeptidase family serine peptidase [Gemmatimonadota bacterium]